MKTPLLTLFGEEIVPEAINAIGNSRSAKKDTSEKAEKKSKEPEKFLSHEIDSLLAPGINIGKQYYSIGEVATIFKVNTSNIRFWTNEFGLKVRTTKKGDRLYTPEQLRELQTIYHLVKEKKYTINGAREKLKNNKTMAVHSIDLKDSLLKLRNKLMAIRNKLV